MKAGMPEVQHPGHNDQASSIPGANRQHPSELAPRVPQQNVREYDQHPAYEKVPVHICGIPRVNVVPAIRANFRTVVLTGTGSNNADIAVPNNAKIKRFYLMANTNPVWVGSKEQVKSPNGPYGALLPAGVWSPPFEGTDPEVWAVATIGASTLTVREEYWAD